jgi:hypothetical protein
MSSCTLLLLARALHTCAADTCEECCRPRRQHRAWVLLLCKPLLLLSQQTRPLLLDHILQQALVV